uniref:cold shock domain-containing protein n=1 Tax=Cupriavidus yeoncheonensis TaxID=1462994 RepID=UPI003F4965F6
MRLTGTLKSWNGDRGFGFIAPAADGRDVFVHISAFPRDGSRPTVGESLDYEVGTGRDGKPAAIRVYRKVVRQAVNRPHLRVQPSRNRRSFTPKLIGLALAIAIGAYGYSTYSRHERSKVSGVAQVAASPDMGEMTQVQFHCDGRTYCSQMTSCSEAKFFLKNCPDTKMDGNHDGVPCEQQWCTAPWSK